MNKEKIIQLVEEYSKKHELAKEVGAEYVWQDDEAQIDAIKLVGEIFEKCFDEFKERSE